MTGVEKRDPIEVVGAVIIREGKVLCAQRPASGRLPSLWEFPGGKVESHETPRQALTREIAEELGCLISVGDEVTRHAHTYEFGVVVLRTFLCEVTGGEPRAIEHSALRWLPPSEVIGLEWAPADIPTAEIVARLST